MNAIYIENNKELKHLKNMISDARGGHVSPGIYTEEKDVTYSVKSLGITSLGLVGETLYGPAFENIEIKDWSEFVDYFGGTSPEKFKGTGAPKYELPYVAKSYLEESKRLNVVRVLGLSGYHAGPAFVVKQNNKPVVILRSKMEYQSMTGTSFCEGSTGDTPNAIVTNVTTEDYKPKGYSSECVKSSTSISLGSENERFSIIATTNSGSFTYNVSLNPQDSDYIYRVLSSTPNGDTPIYIEAVYEASLSTGKFTCSKVGTEANKYIYPVLEKDGKAKYNSETSAYTQDYILSDKTYDEIKGLSAVKVESITPYTANLTLSGSSEDEFKKYVFNKISDKTYDDFITPYRFAVTPWIVSEAYADDTKVTLNKLFRVITISDGDAANTQIKVMFQNIKPKEGLFDVVVRDFNDTDENPVILEKFSKCSMLAGDSSYVGYKIGTSDGGFVSKSKFIAIEMAEGENLAGKVPCGFLGYPMPKYGCSERMTVKYNTEYDPSKRVRKQCFGLTDSVLDIDMLKFKGVYYCGEGADDVTNGFHMDSIMGKYAAGNILIDGISGYTFSCVSSAKVTSDAYQPRLIGGDYINQTIYKDLGLRKFTVCFYGGFDGWDINRERTEGRTNGDNFKATRYPIEGSGAFTLASKVDAANVNLPATAITTDYYAYLAGARVFANPQDVDINIFATPGINIEDHNLLTLEIIDMIESADDGRGGDALYIMNTPEGLDIEGAETLLEDAEIDTSYACTYHPWVMFYDSSNKKYLNLPATKDVVRNMAATDNNSFPWFAPAGIERGGVNCIKAVYKTTLADEDTLYENRINPVKTFAQDGVKIWGNKTAYSVDSPLNRINVRRLMIRVKKLVMDAAKNLIFEQYDDTLEKQFKGLVEPILADVKSNRGIYDYRLITECTEETRDQHILPAKILIKPTPALEYISLSFVVYPESVEFEEN